MVRTPMLWIALCGLLFSSALNAQGTQQLQESADYLPGALLCKLKPATALSQSLLGLDYEKREQALLNKFHLEDEVYGQVRIEPAFQLLEKEYAHLATVYKVSFTNAALTNELLNYLSSFDELEYVERIPERQMLQTITPNDPQYNSQWYLDHIESSEAFWWAQFCNSGLNMSDVTIAVVDDAVYTSHEDLAASIWSNSNESVNGLDDDQNGFIDDLNGWDLGDNDNNVKPPTSGACNVQNGHFDHGTHVAGIAAAVTNNSVGISSLGGGAAILPIKCGRDNFSPHCGGAIFNGYQGIEYAIYTGADIINCSWGGKVYSYTEELIVNTAHTAGIVVVAAAGNEGLESIYYPAAYDKSIAVGATDANDEIASFSNYGSQIDVMAPGVSIQSCLPTSSSAYGAKNGTSMATPVVSGLVALMLAVDPSLAPEDVRDILKNSSEDIYSINDPIYTDKMGAGRINAQEAIKRCCYSSGNLTFNVSSNFQTLCPTQWAHFVAVEQRNRTITASNVSNINWLFPGSAASNNTNTLAPSVAYANEGVYDVTFSYTDKFGDPQSVVLEDYITVRNNVTGFSSEVDNHMYFAEESYVRLANDAAIAENNIPRTLKEGVATVSNIDGNLLFYNIEGTVYNRFHEVMPNGSGLNGQSTTQTLIVPAPGTCKSKFYLFTTGAANSTGLFYSVIDMSLDDGKGDVVDKETPIAPGVIVNEKMTAVPHCNGTDLWVLFQEASTNDIWTLRINTNTHLSPTSTGIMTPSVSATTSTADHAGVMKASPTGDKIAIATNYNNVVEVYNFNRSNGWMSPYCSQAFGHGTYGCEFSPDGNILYVTGASGSISQMDLTSSTCGLTTVSLSDPDDVVSAMELAPNGQIYFTHASFGAPVGFDPNLRKFIGTIKSPNQSGTLCDISLKELEMGAIIQRSTLGNGVISRFMNYQREYALSLPEYLSACEGETVTIASNYQGPTPTYQWCYENGTAISGETGPSIDVTTAGTYLLKVTDAGGCHISAPVIVAFETISQLFPESMEIECGGSLELDAGPGFASYLWSTGETSQSITVTAPGVVYVEVTTTSGCSSTQSINLLPECCTISDVVSPYELEHFSQQYTIVAQGIVQDPSNNVIVAGTSHDKTIPAGQPMSDLGLTLLSANDKGDLNWKRKYTVADLFPFSVVNTGFTQPMSFKVQDMRAGPNSFMMTCMAFNNARDFVGLVIVFDFSGQVLFAREFTSAISNDLWLNSIDDSYDALGNVDGYMVTGTAEAVGGHEIVFAKFKYDGTVTWDQSVGFPSQINAYSHGIESCANLDVNTQNLNGYIIAGVNVYSNAGAADQSIVLLKTTAWGTVTQANRLSNAFHIGSDYKLIPTTTNAGLDRAFVLMYSSSSAVNLIKLDENLNVIWSYAYESATGHDFDHAYDVIEDAGNYKVMARDAGRRAVILNIDQNGLPFSSLFTATGLEYAGVSSSEDFAFEGYNDRLLKQGSNYISIGRGVHQGIGIVKWDVSDATSCTQTKSFGEYNTYQTTSTVNSFQQQHAGLSSSPFEPQEVGIVTNLFCCDNGVEHEIDYGCYFTFDFDFEIPCGQGEIVIPSVDIFGAGGIATYSWELDGVPVSTDELPTLTGISDGSYTVCLTISYGPSCSKQVCKTIELGPEYLTETIETCNGSVWYQPESCSTYYSYEMIDHDPSDDLWHNYNYNSLTDPTYGGPGCAGWIAHNLIIGHYTILLKDDAGCTEAILEVFVVPTDTLVEYDTLKACGSTWYTPDSCGKYESYRMVDHDPSDDQWHDYNYNSLTDPTYGGPGCSGWIAHNLIVGHYTIYFDDANGCTQKVLHLTVMPDTVYKTKDIYVCPGECKTIDITNPDYFCQPNSGYFYGYIDDGVQVSQLLLTSSIQICYPMSGTFEFITWQANGCVCVVRGKIIPYAPCPEPSAPGGPTSIASVAEEGQLEAYPNPTTGLLVVNYQGTLQQGAQLMVIDLLGKTQMETTLNEHTELDLTTLSSGTYMLIVRNGALVSRKKIVKE